MSDSSDFLDLVVTELRGQGHAVEPVLDDPHPDALPTITLSLIVANDGEIVDLAFLPRSSWLGLVIEPAGKSTLTLRGLPEDCDLHIGWEPDSDYNQFENVELVEFAGTVLPRRGDEYLVYSAIRPRGLTLTVGPEIKAIAGPGFDNMGATIEVTDGQANVTSSIAHLRVRGAINLVRVRPARLPSSYQPVMDNLQESIQVLELTDDAELTMATVFSIVQVEGQGQPRLRIDHPDWLLTGGEATEPDTDDQFRNYDIDALDNVDLTGPSRLIVRIVNRIQNSTVSGPLVLSLNGRAIGQDVHFGSHNHSCPTLRMGTNAVLTNATGHINLGIASHAFLNAGRDGLNVIAGPEPIPEHAWRGLVLSGVQLPTGLPGRQMLASMGDAYHLAPNVDNVPGRDQTVWARLRMRHHGAKVTDYNDNTRQLEEDAEFTRELARLTKSKGAPGSVTTRLAWSAYRLRAIKATGFIEQRALGVYRLLGYGERPMPAFTTWLVLALVLAGPVLAADGLHFDPTEEGFRTWATEVGRLTLGPFAGVPGGPERPGTDTTGGATDTFNGGDFAEILARVLVTIPFVTGSLALRNYVKSDSTS